MRHLLVFVVACAGRKTPSTPFQPPAACPRLPPATDVIQAELLPGSSLIPGPRPFLTDCILSLHMARVPNRCRRRRPPLSTSPLAATAERRQSRARSSGTLHLVVFSCYMSRSVLLVPCVETTSSDVVPNALIEHCPPLSPIHTF